MAGLVSTRHGVPSGVATFVFRNIHNPFYRRDCLRFSSHILCTDVNNNFKCIVQYESHVFHKSRYFFSRISIVLMMFVNHGAGGYWFLSHATWDGLYVGDLVFPWFLWIMGVCIPLSIRPQLAKGASRGRLLLAVIWVSNS